MQNKTLLKTTLIFMLSFVISAAHAITKSHEDLVNQVILRSGLDQHFAGFDQILSVSIEQTLALEDKSDQSEKKKLKEIFVRNFSNLNFMQQVREAISLNLDEMQLKSLLKIFDDAVFNQFLQAELASSKAESVQDLILYASDLGQTQPSQDRLKIVKRLDSVTHAEEALSSIMMNTFETMVRSANTIHKKFTDEQLAQMLNNYRAVVNAQVANQIIISYLYTYRNFTDKELDNYVKTYESNAELRKYNDTVLYTINDYFNGYAQRIATDMAVLLKNKEKA